MIELTQVARKRIEEISLIVCRFVPNRASLIVEGINVALQDPVILAALREAMWPPEPSEEMLDAGLLVLHPFENEGITDLASAYKSMRAAALGEIALDEERGK